MEVGKFVLLGLGVGALYTLAAQGLILVYRGSGVLNFAHGAMGMVAAFLFFDLRDTMGLPTLVALVLAVMASGLLGLMAHGIMAALRTGSGLAKLIATLGLFTFLQYAAVRVWGGHVRLVKPVLPSEPVELLPGVVIGSDRIWLFALAIVGTWALDRLYRSTRFGAATTAVAENATTAAALGWSPPRIAAANWAFGAALGGGTALLMAPIVGLSVTSLSLLVLPALAAALIGRFSSFVLTCVGAMGIGITEALFGRYVTTPGLAKSVPFLVIIAMLIFRGTPLPIRGELAARPPSVGLGIIRWRVLAPLIAVAVGAILLLPVRAVDATTTSLLIAILLLSLIVVTGYAGQLSLAQFALAGMGAWIATRAAVTFGLPFEVALLVGMLGAVPVGLIVAIPALRTRGVNLAVATLGLALVLEQLVFGNPHRTGGLEGTNVGFPTVFGIPVGATQHPHRYAIVALTAFILVALVITNVRRGRSGRRLAALRTNERAAAAMGIDVYRAKLFAFALASAIAGLAGTLLAYRAPRVVWSQFGLLESINVVVLAVIGGIGFIAGALVGSLAAVGGLTSHIMGGLGETVDQWNRFLAGIVVILVLVQDPDGLVSLARRQYRAVVGFARRRPRSDEPTGPAPSTRSMAPTTAGSPPASLDPQPLTIDGLSVQFGGTHALVDASLRVVPGRIVGLIGPNGAGKSTLVEAATGFVEPRAGTVGLGDQCLDGWRPDRRARAGVARTFQSLELFEDLSVRENLLAAADDGALKAYLLDLIRPAAVPLSAGAEAAVQLLGLADKLDARPTELSHGDRRLLSMARAIACQPAVLLLDEPAAGLDSAETEHLGEAIKQIAHEWGIGILLIEHDIELVLGVADEVVALDFGRIIAAGPPDEIRKDPAVVAAYLGQPTEPTLEQERMP